MKGIGDAEPKHTHPHYLCGTRTLEDLGPQGVRTGIEPITYL
jgi:hypothetical protein